MAKCLAMLLSQSVLRLEIALGCEYLITVHAAMLSHHTQHTAKQMINQLNMQNQL
jgi:hypothetical protein